jgi:hypothetical protein
MFNNFQHAINNILENMNSVGDVFMSGSEATGNIVTDPDIKTAMSIAGSNIKKKKKKKNIIRRKLNRKDL